ncbi:MAG: hypothetical protein GC168_20265 [Candidatus Hydrogenedens sp.]|nr:hypothetical protein [Candidatus Hydrogenedens sp.]
MIPLFSRKLPDTFGSILVHLPNWLGDAAMATPALRVLRRRFPKARITACGLPGACALIEGLPHVDALLPIPGKPGFREMRAYFHQHFPERAELGIALPHSFRAAAALAAAGCRRRLGYTRGGRSFLLTHTLRPHVVAGNIMPVYMAFEYLRLLAPLCCDDDDLGLELHADTELVESLRSRLDPARPVVGIAPGAAFGPSKQWLPERYAAVADRLAEEHNAQVLLFTGPDEEDTRSAVLEAARHPLIDPQGDQPSIARLKAGIRCCDLLLGNDSAPRHIAIAFGVPVVCIMGPTSPRYTESPWERGVVLRRDVDCGPCQKPVCVTDHRCMTLIGVDDVAAAAGIWLRP